MRLRFLLLAALAALGGCQTGGSDAAPDTSSPSYAVDNLRRGMPYSEARAVLAFGGWEGQPYPAATAAQRCVGRDECAIYPETELCSGPGLGTCRFNFVNGDGERLVVTAAGASPGQMRLNGWGYVR